MAMNSTDGDARPLLDESREAPGEVFESEGEEQAYEESQKVAVNIGDFGGEDDAHVPPFSWRKLWLFMGPGFLMSIAFLDPGNLEGSLQAGAIAGYSLLWLLMWATAMGLLIQLLAARLGVATGRHLAELCRLQYPPVPRITLWIMAEIALIGADIQEVIGSAIAIKVLTHGYIPLWGGVLITALDCFIFLFLENYGVRKLEALFGLLITTMALSFAWMFGEAKPNGVELLLGLLIPRIHSNAVKQAVSIVGCSIMPHNVYLHSALVQSRMVDTNKKVFAKGFYGTKASADIGLVNAGTYLQEKYGGGLFPVLYIWGIGLLASGHCSTITGTYAGQFIMAGFLNLRIKKWLRAVITRSFAIVPTVIVALMFDTSEDKLDILNEWLNVLQSMQIPFSLIPLLSLVSREQVMGFFKINRTLKVVAWLVAFLVMIMNGYLLEDFFANELMSMWVMILLIFIIVAYVSFIIYLVVQAFRIDRSFDKLLR